MSKPLRVAGEVDSWCTKCNMILNHVIVSMVGPKPVQVKCLTCNGQHMYRPHAPGQKPAASGTRSGSTAPRAASSRTATVTRAQQAAVDREKTWEKAIAGKAMSDFKPYRINLSFAEGDLVRHSRFGDGLVTRVVDARKIEVLFKDDTRTLAQAMTD